MVTQAPHHPPPSVPSLETLVCLQVGVHYQYIVNGTLDREYGVSACAAAADPAVCLQ